MCMRLCVHVRLGVHETLCVWDPGTSCVSCILKYTGDDQIWGSACTGFKCEGRTLLIKNCYH